MNLIYLIYVKKCICLVQLDLVLEEKQKFFSRLNACRIVSRLNACRIVSRLNACRIEATLETFFEEIFPVITQLNVNFLRNFSGNHSTKRKFPSGNHSTKRKIGIKVVCGIVGVLRGKWVCINVGSLFYFDSN